jgi:hypothetical protein
MKSKQQTLLRDWLFKLPVTHEATINTRWTHRAPEAVEQLTRRFLFKFNGQIWGKNTWKYGKGCEPLSVVPIVHNERDIDSLHIHFAFYGFPATLTDTEIKNRFEDVAKHTDGIQYYSHVNKSTDGKPSLAVDFGQAKCGGAWMNYITRKLSGSTDENIMFQHMYISPLT